MAYATSKYSDRIRGGDRPGSANGGLACVLTPPKRKRGRCTLLADSTGCTTLAGGTASLKRC
jgi:hypothetical protein